MIQYSSGWSNMRLAHVSRKWHSIFYHCQRRRVTVSVASVSWVTCWSLVECVWILILYAHYSVYEAGGVLESRNNNLVCAYIWCVNSQLTWLGRLQTANRARPHRTVLPYLKPWYIYLLGLRGGVWLVAHLEAASRAQTSTPCQDSV